jgi:hypothetical protein
MNLFIHFRHKFLYEFVLFFWLRVFFMNKNYVSCIIFCYILIYDNHAWNSEIKKKNIGSIVTQFSESTKNINFW